MTLLAHPDELDLDPEGGESADTAVVNRPRRWAVSNWPVQWKVLAIALVPMLLAGIFGSLRISSALGDAARLRSAADNAEMVPAINDYLGSLGSALVAASSGGDTQGAKKNFENRRDGLRSRLTATDVPADVRSGVTTLLDGGQALLNGVLAGGIGLRDEVTGYAPILLTAEDAINGSVRVADARIRAQAEGLSRAVGARGQMLMQELLVNRGGELEDQDLRTAMITLAGTEPSTLFGMSQVLGVDSPDAKTLQRQMVTRMSIMSNPESVLPNNAELTDSIRATDTIANRVIDSTTRTVTATLADRAAERRSAAVRDIVLVLTALAVALVVVGLVARSLVRPLRTLRDSALRVAHTDLENEIARVRSGDEREPRPLPVYTSEEVGQVAHAVDELHARALLLAGDEARLRLLVNEMFETMSRRNRSLVDQQLSLIDRLERNEGDPDRLESLFQLDHLAARMRRNGANLMVLADARSTADTGRPLALSAVLSAAVSEVEAYRRVEMMSVPDIAVAGVATGDLVHLLAELIDNALRYSPPTTPVRVSAELARGGGAVVEVIDAGLGMTATDMRMANTRLEAGGEVSPENARRMGLFVVGRLAQRHGITVRLSRVRLAADGVVAETHLPPGLLLTGAPAPPSSRRAAEPAPMPQQPQPTPPAVPTGASATGAHNGSEADADAGGSSLPRRAPGASGITGAPAPASPAFRTPPAPGAGSESPEPAGPDPLSGPVPTVSSGSSGTPDPLNDDLIYQRMLSEWLTDPHELGRSTDLDWRSVWDHGWSTAAEVDNVPIMSHTESGLPVREPGVRLVPGAAGVPDTPDRAAHRRSDTDPAPVAGNGAPHHAAHRAPERNPDAVRASISSHFGGVHAARARAREVRRATDQGPDHR